ncbi:MAG: glycosyltransferase [candidate division WOR-3 bacterium]
MGSEAKILFVCDFYPNKYKPYEGVFFRYHALSLSKKFKVRVQTLIRLNRFGYERWEDGGVEVEAFIMPYKVGFGFIFLPIAVTLQFLLGLKNLLLFRPNRVLLHMGLPQGLAFLWMFKGFYVVEHSDHIWEGFNKFLSFVVFAFAKRVGAVSSWQAEMMERVFSIKPFVLGNPLPDIPFKPSSQKNAILFVGTITPKKNPIVVLDVARVLENLEFYFVGRNFNDDYFESFLKKLGKTVNAKYLGALAHEEVLNILREAALLVSTSDSETFGYAIAEALALGKPVVWFDSGGPRDFLNEENSVLVRRKTPLALACGILGCLGKIKNGEFNPEGIRVGIYKNYSFDAVLNRYIEFLNLTDF